MSVSVFCSPSNNIPSGQLTEAIESGMDLFYSDRSEKVHHLKGK